MVCRRVEDEGESRGKVASQEREKHDAIKLHFATVGRVESLGAGFHQRKAGVLKGTAENHYSMGSWNLP